LSTQNDFICIQNWLKVITNHTKTNSIRLAISRLLWEVILSGILSQLWFVNKNWDYLFTVLWQPAPYSLRGQSKCQQRTQSDLLPAHLPSLGPNGPESGLPAAKSGWNVAKRDQNRAMGVVGPSAPRPKFADSAPQGEPRGPNRCRAVNWGPKCPRKRPLRPPGGPADGEKGLIRLWTSWNQWGNHIANKSAPRPKVRPGSARMHSRVLAWMF